MNQLRIILDKSVVYGLSDSEIDSLDRYFFQIIPPILMNEILADLAKADEAPRISDKIARHSYRISGTRGLTLDYRIVLENSLMGNEIPMDGKYLPAGEAMVQSNDGSIGTLIETTLEDEMIARWEAKEFHESERTWAPIWRRRMERPISTKLYLNKIAEAGLHFARPKDLNELIVTVDSLLAERRLQPRLLVLLARAHDIPYEVQDKITKRWFKEGRPMFAQFAPYAFFCLRADVLWALALTNPSIFKPDKNDRKDLQYCYYLPHCEIFVSKDNKHRQLAPFLLRPDQSFVDGETLKLDLKELSAKWDALSRDERIQLNAERGFAPPEHEDSLVFQLWKKHRNTITKSLPLELLQMKLVDSSKPPDEQVEFTLEDLVRAKYKELNESRKLSDSEIQGLKRIHQESPATRGIKKTTLNKERILKMYPQLNESDLVRYP